MTVKAKFEMLYDELVAAGKVVNFEDHWDNGTGYLDAITRADIAFGAFAFVTHGELPGRKGIVVKLGALQMAIFERYNADDNNILAFNGDSKVHRVFHTMNRGENRVQEEGFKFFHQMVEQANTCDFAGF